MKKLFLLLFIPLVSLSQSFDDIMSITFKEDFVRVMVENGYERTSKKWSVTTSRHINKWLDGVLAKEQPQEYFDSLCAGF